MANVLNEQTDYILGRHERITEKYIFFWKGILSQWYPTAFRAQIYSSSIRGWADSFYMFYNCEQYMMLNKALFMGDGETAAAIMNTTKPKEIKDLGRAVKNYDEELWSTVRYDVVIEGNFWRRQHDSGFRQILDMTKPAILVEASPYDDIWGIGLRQEDDRVLDEQKWEGKNLLGMALTTVRDNYMCAEHKEYRNKIIEYLDIRLDSW